MEGGEGTRDRVSAFGEILESRQKKKGMCDAGVSIMLCL